MMGAGASNTSALCFGGADPTRTDTVEGWNGSSWINENNMPTATQTGAGAGIKTAALAIGGNTAADSTEDQTLEWYGDGLLTLNVTTS